MCCIFTCCGWMIDLLQRVWVFIMSCCICTAVCCVLITTSMSGVALGYNYSLAEYIDTKETNVSVYIKRGVFDDDVVDDIVDFRRKGRESLRGFIQNDNLKTATEEVGPDQMPVASGRRLDDSILESNDQNNFEGSLMKLTLKPPYPSPSSETRAPDDSAMIPVMSSYPPDSLDQLKAIQGIINARKAEAARNPLDKDAGTSTYGYGDVNAHYPGTPDNAPEQYRRMMSLLSGPGYQRPDLSPQQDPLNQNLPPISPARFAVPSVISRGNWEAPKMTPEEYRRTYNIDSANELPPSMPKPVTYRTGPLRPPTTERSTEYTLREFSKFTSQAVSQAEQRSPERGKHDQSIIEEKFGSEERFDERSGSEDDRKNDFLKKLPGPKIIGQENNEYYDEELKGLPVRRRRSINHNNGKLQLRTKVNPGFLTKFKVDKSISNEITDYPSILVSKLHFLDNALSNETTSANQMEVRNGTKAVELTVNDTRPITDSTIGKVLK